MKTASNLFSQTSQTIAIIGGGFSGTLVAVHLLRSATTPITIHLVERRSAIGQGVAYSTSFNCHLLNVPAGKMSAFADEPNHFLHWAQQQPRQQEVCLSADRLAHSQLLPVQGSPQVQESSQRSNLLVAEPPQPAARGYSIAAMPPITAQTFVSRQLYGKYLQSVLQAAIDRAPVGVQWEPIVDEAIAIHPKEEQDDQVVVTLSSGKQIQATQVVLALGNFPPSNLPVADPSFYQSHRYVCSAWSLPESIWSETSYSSQGAVLLIGSGLTAIDQVVALHQQGYRGQIWMVSRRGLLPQSHQFAIEAGTGTATPYSADWLASLTSPTLCGLIRQVRQEVKRAAAQGYDWRAVIDSLRAVTPRLWQSLSIADQKQFLRHVRPYWDTHRHRIPPEIAQLIRQLRQSGQLQVCAGQIQAYNEDTQGVDVMIRKRNRDRLIVRANWVINCTGSEDNYSRLQDRLIQQLISAGLVRSNPLNMGLDAGCNGTLTQSDGTPSPWLYTLGSPCKGQRWETTAVPELRVQAKQLAEQIIQSQ